ncbi:MAG: hypothetical protein RL757_1934 [Bacteroidota bacterium]|jgi:hypothetical protein
MNGFMPFVARIDVWFQLKNPRLHVRERGFLFT